MELIYREIGHAVEKQQQKGLRGRKINPIKLDCFCFTVKHEDCKAVLIETRTKVTKDFKIIYRELGLAVKQNNKTL